MTRLRELERTDIPAINRWRQDRSLTASLGAPHRHIGFEVDERWFDAYLARRGTDVRCAICRETGSDPVGLVSLTGIDPVHRHAELHILLGERDAHGQGIGTEATRTMVHHGFRDLNLHRIYLFVLDSNAAARHMYEKVGFRAEGTLREAAFKDGRYQDVHVMGLLQAEFRQA
jgi:RimJ/RimL family protein N-acetyltransferase